MQNVNEKRRWGNYLAQCKQNGLRADEKARKDSENFELAYLVHDTLVPILRVPRHVHWKTMSILLM
jgi:hypothetical protein